MKSNNLSAVDDQAVIEFKNPIQPIDIALVRKITTLTGAIQLCISLSGFDDKQIYVTLGIDAGQWTRIKNGTAHFPQDKLRAFMDFCGNEAPLIWLSDISGYKLVKKESELERQLRIKDEELAAERLKNQALIEAFRGAQ